MAGAEVCADFWMNEYITPWDIYAHGITQVLAYKKTAFQEMYVVETGSYGKALILDGKWQSCTGEEFLYHEALVHPAMCFQGAPQKVLILGGGEGATAREVLRWKTVTRVVMVDIDGEVVEACKQHLPEMHQNAFDDPRLQVIIGDALQVLETTDGNWDLVISDLSDPIEEGPAFQLFTQEYFEEVKRVLSPQGFFVVQAGAVSPVLISLHARLVRTLQAVFPHVHAYSSHAASYGTPWGYAIASAQAMNTQPEPVATDRLLSTQTTGGFRLIDGIALLGLLQTPLYLRQAIEAETHVYTMAAPPQYAAERAEVH
jgi:spermidine synthase